MKNYLLTIEYDGSVFHGWQRQPENNTVQGAVENALEMLCGRHIQIDGTSRTDAGVHALRQRASFKADIGIPAERITKALNDILASENRCGKRAGAVRIIDAQEVSMDFHARYDARAKTYIYRIRNMNNISVFERNLCLFVRDQLDLDAMKTAAKKIEGTHDFACFQAAGGQKRYTTVRTIESADVTVNNDGIIEIIVTGNGFLYKMVRMIAGTLIEVGSGRMDAEDIGDIIRSKERNRAGHTAPPQGLFLADIYY